MSDLVEDLLLLARLDAGVPLRSVPVELASVVVDALADAQVIGPDHRWVADLGEDPASIVVCGERSRLLQVVTNLLTNARVHTPGGTTVTARLLADGAEAVLRVIDDGPGIPPEVQERIFDRFSRGDDSRSRSSGSTGLGLAIVEGIVTTHGGRVQVQSGPEGTEVTIRLPLAEQS